MVRFVGAVTLLVAAVVAVVAAVVGVRSVPDLKRYQKIKSM